MKTKNLLRLSLCVNLILSLLFLSVSYFSRNYLMERYRNLSVSIPSAEELLRFNPRTIDVSYQHIDIGSDSTITMQFIGNSISRHSVVDYWDKERGMASSEEEKDFVHQVVKMVSISKNVNVNYSICSIFDFERNFYNPNVDWVSYVDSIRYGDPDYLIVQIGENTNPEQLEKYKQCFKEKYISILSLFPNSKKIITTPFWPRPNLNYLYEDIAIESHSALCDISHLGADIRNQAISEENNFNRIVLTHPGDFGMKNIAKCIFSIINAERE